MFHLIGTPFCWKPSCPGQDRKIQVFLRQNIPSFQRRRKDIPTESAGLSKDYTMFVSSSSGQRDRFEENHLRVIL